MVKYSGDLYQQISKPSFDSFDEKYSWCSLDGALGHDIKYSLIDPDFKRVSVPACYDKYQATRGAVVTESCGDGKPTVVVFRDSTCDFLVDFLSGHFKRAVYIWDKGNVYQDVIEIEKPDLVLHFMAERFVSSYPSRKALN